MLSIFVFLPPIAATIIIANQLYGVVELFNKNGINYFDNRDVELLHEAIQWSTKVIEVCLGTQSMKFVIHIVVLDDVS